MEMVSSILRMVPFIRGLLKMEKLLVRGGIFIIMDASTKDKLEITMPMDLESTMTHFKDITMRVHGKTILQMEKVKKNSPTVLTMRVNFLMDFVMEQEGMCRTQEYMRVNLMVESFMEKELLLIPTIENMQEVGKMD